MNEKNQINELMGKTALALNKNNMQTFIVSTKEEALRKVTELMQKGTSVSMGGSMTLKECGIADLLASGDYEFLDRSKAKNDEEKLEIYRKSFFCDTYLSSSNAITLNGELYNVDGNSNRVAAMLYGPKQLIVVAGYNKIVENIDEAVIRVKEKAAPPNCERLNIDTFCRKQGKCVSLTKEKSFMCDGCASDGRICSSYVVMSHQRIKDRVKVILVGEELGY